MSVTVRVWSENNGDHGHASLEFRDQYISFWPGNEANPMADKLKNPDGKGNVKDFTLSVQHTPTLSRKPKMDSRLLKRQPDYIAELPKMNEELMEKCWQEFKAQPKTYNTLNSNCSTVVASFLELGCGIPYGITPSVKIKEYVSNPFKQLLFKIRFNGNSVNMWRPKDVKHYTFKIKSGKR